MTSDGPATNSNGPLAGIGYALLAYSAWGLMPIYWKLVDQVPALQMLAHRVVWSVLVLAVLVGLFRRWSSLRTTLRSRQHVLLLLITATLISFNWLTFIWAVQNNHVVEASLGYFINPLFNVVLGFVFLRERLRPWQIAAVCLASLGVINLMLTIGVVPWIALALALSFGTYGLLRKMAPVEGLVGLSVETVLMFPVALGYLVYVGFDDKGAFLHAGWRLDTLIAAAGLITALPLLWFTNAAKRLDYSTLGIVQYLAPSCQLLLAVFVYGEAFTVVHMVTFGCIWTALAIYTTDTTFALRRRSSIRADSALQDR